VSKLGKMKNRLIQFGSCITASMIITVAFYLGALELGNYTVADIYLGAIWTFVLSMIISSPIIIPLIRKRISN
jgi:hypothetical protein